MPRYPGKNTCDNYSPPLGGLCFSTIRPESEFFSTNILTDQNYLQRHDVKCRLATNR